MYLPHPQVSRKPTPISSSRRTERALSRHSIRQIRPPQAAGHLPKPPSLRESTLLTIYLGRTPLRRSVPWAFTHNTWCRRRPYCLNKLGGPRPRSQLRTEILLIILRTGQGPPPFYPQTALLSLNLPRGPSSLPSNQEPPYLTIRPLNNPLWEENPTRPWPRLLRHNSIFPTNI